MTREEQKEQRRQQIIVTGLNLFVKKGFTGTKIADIAREAGMSTGLLFHYFPSKEKLLEELVRMGLEGSRMPLQLQVDSPIDFFRVFVNQLFTYMRESPYMAQMFVLMAQMQKTGGIPDEIREMALQVDTIEQTVPIIEAGQRMGQIRQGDPLALSNAFWCSIQGITEHLALFPQIPLPEAEWILAILKP